MYQPIYHKVHASPSHKLVYNPTWLIRYIISTIKPSSRNYVHHFNKLAHQFLPVSPAICSSPSMLHASTTIFMASPPVFCSKNYVHLLQLLRRGPSQLLPQKLEVFGIDLPNRCGVVLAAGLTLMHFYCIRWGFHSHGESPKWLVYNGKSDL